MEKTMPVSEETDGGVALEDPEGQWELSCGRLRSKPGMATEHNYAQYELADCLGRQLDHAVYIVSQNAARLRISTGSFYIPDLCVVPRDAQRRLLAERPRRL